MTQSNFRWPRPSQTRRNSRCDVIDRGSVTSLKVRDINTFHPHPGTAWFDVLIRPAVVGPICAWLRSQLHAATGHGSAPYPLAFVPYCARHDPETVRETQLCRAYDNRQSGIVFAAPASLSVVRRRLLWRAGTSCSRCVFVLTTITRLAELQIAATAKYTQLDEPYSASV